MNLFDSIRRSAARDVRFLRAGNRALRSVRGPYWLRVLGRIISNRSLFRLLGMYAIVWGLTVLAGASLTLQVPKSLAPVLYGLGKPETIREVLSYMLGAQATMVGLIFPLALGMVTLIVQRDEGVAAHTDVQLYYDQSLAYAVGTSGIALAIALVGALLAPEILVLNAIGRSAVTWSISLALLIVLAIWLFANLLLAWQFLITSLSFIAPSHRAMARRRFVAARVIPRHLAALLSDYSYVHISDRLFSNAIEDMPFVMPGASEGLRGDAAVTVKFGKPRDLFDVRLGPLRLAVRLWAWRCTRAGTGPGSGKYDWMLGLAGPLGRTLEGDVVLCRRKGGVPLGSIERWLIRRSLVFRAPVEGDDLGPSDIMEELADRVGIQIDRTATTGFSHALREMREFHRFLLTAYTAVDENGIATSYAAYGSTFSEHSNWVREYRRLFERAVAVMERDDSFIGSLAYMAANLIPAPKESVPPWIVGGLYEFPQYMVHRVGHWLTAQRAPRGQGLRGLTPGALPPQIAKSYRGVALRMVGGHESALHAGASYGLVPDGLVGADAWDALVRSWPILFKHIESAAYLVVAAQWHEDDIGADLFAESFLRWRQTLGDLGEGDGRYILRTTLMSCALVDLDWEAVLACVSPLLRHPNSCAATPEAVYSAILANLHADVRVVTACVLAGWAGEGIRIFEAAPAAKRLAAAAEARRGGAPLNLVQTLVRLRMAEWSADASAYVSLLDDVVRKLDGMIEGERVPGRVYPVESRFRVGSLTPDWFALVVALSDADSFAVIEQWLSQLGADENAASIGDDNLWQLQNWLDRTASRWTTAESQAKLLEAIEALRPVLDATAGGDGLHAALAVASAAIAAHRHRRLAVAPIASQAITRFETAAADALKALIGRIAMFPAARIEFSTGPRGKASFKLTGVDKKQLVDDTDKTGDGSFPERYADRLAGHAAGLAWRPYFKLPRRRVAVRTLRELFEAAAEEGERIARTGARPIVLMPVRSDSWPDIYQARREMGDAVSKRKEAGLAETYLYSYAGVDFYSSRLRQPEIFPDNLLELVSVVAPDPSRPAEITAMPEADPTDITVSARISVSARWRDAEVVVLVRRTSRRRKSA